MTTGFTYRHYILKDHLGSWTTITDAEGNVEQELSYDAWDRRNPNTEEVAELRSLSLSKGRSIELICKINFLTCLKSILNTNIMNYLSGFFILLFCLNSIGYSQNIPNGLYVADGTDQFICIKGDSISFNLNDFQSIFYYGKYHMLEKSLILESNCAVGNNTIISTSECDSNYMEIELVEWKHDFLFGEPISHSKPYLSKSDLFSVCLCSKVFQSNDTVLRISKDQLPCMTFDSLFFFASGTMTGYIDKVDLPLSFGKKYILTQKHFNCQPAMEGDYPEIILKKKGKNTFLYYYNGKMKKMICLKRSGDCESCLGELRKLYPDF